MTESDIPGEILLAPAQVKRSTESRLPSASNARQGLRQLLKEDEPRSYERAIVKGCYDGNAPYSQKKLNQDGQRWRCNLNFRGLEGTMDSARIPYYGLFSGVPTYATFKTRYQAASPLASRWEKIIEQKFTCMLDRWEDFKWNMQCSQFEMLFEGWGPLIFDKDADWRFRSISARSFLVPQDSPSSLNKRIPWFAVRCPYRVHELYDCIRDERAARARGWDVEAVKNAIKFGTRSVEGDLNGWQNQPWEEWQKRYKNKNLMSSYTECDIIRCAHLYVQEYSGKVSHFIITENSVYPDDKTNSNEDAFLFSDPNKYDSYKQIANVAFQNTGDGTWHSVRGIGLKSYGYEEVQNRLNCRIVDNANMASMILLKGNDAKSNQKMQLYVNGAIGMIPPGTEMEQNRLAGDIPSVMGVTRMLENKLANKIGAFNQRSMAREDGRGEQPTATQIEMAAAKEGSLSASQIDNYYLDLDALYSEVFRRAKDSTDPDAKQFVQDCLDSGVPREALDNMEYVRANRRSGYGSPQMRKMAMDRLMAVYPTLPEDGKRNALDEYITSEFGADKIEVFNPPMEEISQDEWMATMENDKLHVGELPLILSGMDHVAHLNIHLDDAEQRLAPLQQALEGGEELDINALNEAATYVQALAQHCEQHLSKIEGDPAHKQIAEYFEAKLKIVTSFHGKLRSAVRSAQARAAQAAREEDAAVQLDALTQAKLQREQAGMENDRAKTMASIQDKALKTQAGLQTKRFQVGQNSALTAAQTAEKIRLDRIETAAKIDNQRKLNGAKAKGSKATK